MSEFELAIKLY